MSRADGSPRRLWHARRWLWVIGSAATACLLAFALLHSAPVRRRVLDWTAVRLAVDAGIDLRAGSLDYDLRQLRVTLSDATLSAVGADTPFLTVDRVTIDIPWRALWSRFAIESLIISGPHVTIQRDATGAFNLPAARAGDSGGGSILPLEIDRFAIDDLSLSYADVPMALSIRGAGLSVDTTRPAGAALEGRLRVDDGIAIDVGGRATTLSRASATMAWLGDALRLDDLALAAPEGELRASGRIDLADTASQPPRIDLTWTADTPLEAWQRWLPAAEPAGGTLHLTGRIAGALAEPDVSVDLSGDGLRWAATTDLSLRARASLTPDAVVVDALELAAGAQRVSGTGRLSFGDQRSELALTLAALDLSRLIPAPPIRTSGSVSGTAQASWLGPNPLTADLTADARLLIREGRQRRSVPVAGRLALAVAERAWRLDVAGARLGEVALAASASGTLDVTSPGESTLTGSMTANSTDLAGLLRTLEAGGVAVDSLPRDAAGQVAIRATLGGTFSTPRAEGRVEARELTAWDLGPAALDATFAASPDAIALSALELTSGADRLAGDGAADLRTGRLRGTFALRIADLATYAALAAPDVPVAGSMTADGSFAGTTSRPTGSASFAASDLAVAGQPPADLTGTLQLADDVITATNVRLTRTAPGAAIESPLVEASGTYALQSRRYTVQAAGRQLEIVPIRSSRVEAEDGSNVLPLRTRVGFDLRGEGSLDAPGATLELSAEDVQWQGESIGAITGSATLAGGVATATVAAPALTAALSGRAALAAPHEFTVEGTTTALDVARLARLLAPRTDASRAALPADLGGSVAVRVEASGTADDLSTSTARVDASLADLHVGDVPIQSNRAFQVEYTGGIVTVTNLDVQMGATSLTANGRLDPRAGAAEGIDVALRGNLSDLMPLAQFVPVLSTTTAAGAVDVAIRASGPLEDLLLSGGGSLADTSVQVGSLPAVTGAGLRLAIDGDLVRVDDLHAAWQGASLAGTAAMPISFLAGRAQPSDGPASSPAMATFDLSIGGLTTELAAPFVEPAALDGIDASAAVRITGTARSLAADDVEAQVRFDTAELSAAGVSLAQQGQTSLRLAGGRLAVEHWDWRGGDNQLTLSGFADLTPDQTVLDARLGGTLDLRLLGAFMTGVATAGRATADVHATGPIDAPLLDGTVTVADGDVTLRDPRIAITDLTGTLALANDHIQLVSVGAQANGGTVTASGEVQLAGFQPAGGAIDVRGRGLALEAPADLQTELDLDLRLDLTPSDPALTGRVTILRGAYREPISLATQLLTQIETRPAVAQPRGWIDDVRLGIDVDSTEGVVVDNNYGRLALDSRLRVIGTVDRPALSGRLVVQDGGVVLLAGQTWRVERATIDFTNPTTIEPTFDIAMTTRVSSYEMGLTIAGTPARLEANLRPPDGLSQADAISLLLTGEPAASTSVVEADVAREQLVLLLSGELLSFASRAVGLDSARLAHGLGGAASDFDLIATDTDPSTRLTLTKRLGANVDVILSQNLRESSDLAWIAIYRPTRAIEIQGSTREASARSYEFRHELTFGGPGRGDAAAPARAEAVTQPLVADVRIEGLDAADAAVARRLIDIDPGDRFDFFRWLDSRDRLVRHFQDQGRLEARVRASREPAGVTPAGPQATDTRAPGPSQAVALIYAIDPGPRTSLRVEGGTLSGDVLDEMRQQWAEAVYDGFLRTDLTRIARRALLGDGYVNARVTTRVETDAAGDTKTIVLSLDPGARSRRRTIEIAGATTVAPARLLAELRARQLDESIWLDPSDAESALDDYLGTLGYLNATVTARTPVVNGDEAVLTVDVDEGPLFHVRTVSITGADAARTGDVRTAFGVGAGAPYVPAALESGRRAVELEYRRRGFNDARVSLVSAIDAATAAADLTLAVDEGARQVIAEVSVEGAQRTARSAIDAALDMRTGEPAVLADTYVAQKHLYDTGAFRTAEVALEPIGPPDDGVQPVRAVVRVDEVAPYRLRYGVRLRDEVAGIELDREVRPGFVVDLLRRNLFGRAVSAGIAGQIESDRRLARAVLSSPRLFGVPIRTSLYLTRSRQTFGEDGPSRFTNDGSDATLEQRLPIGSSIVVSYTYRFTRTHSFSAEQGPFALDLETDVARLTSSFAWDTRDDPFDSHRGWFHSSTMEYAAAALGSDLRFVKYIGQQYYFRTVGAGGTVLASALRVGLERGLGGQDVITSERFFAGGGTSVRGFGERTLGERTFLGDVSGGNGSVILNQEVRFPVYRWLRGVGFVDAGNVFPRVRDVSLTDLEAGIGAGLRIDTPFGLGRIDVGIPLTDRDDRPAVRWYVSLGQAF